MVPLNAESVIPTWTLAFPQCSHRSIHQIDFRANKSYSGIISPLSHWSWVFLRLILFCTVGHLGGGGGDVGYIYNNWRDSYLNICKLTAMHCTFSAQLSYPGLSACMYVQLYICHQCRTLLTSVTADNWLITDFLSTFC